MKNPVWLLVLLSWSLWQLGETAFSCRRTGMTCANNGTCDTEGKCLCAEGFTGFDCGLQNSTITTGCTICQNGGTCYNATQCYCAENFYGATCQFKRAGVECLHDRMEINVFPHGDFQGRMFILGQDRNNCSLTPLSNQTGTSYEGGPGLQGFGIQLSHLDLDCGNATLVETEQSRNYSREVVLEYNVDYVTSLDELVRLTCSERGKTGEEGVVFASSSRTVQLNESSMYEKSDVENAYEPLSFKVKDKNNETVTSNSEPLAVGDKITLDFELSSTDKYKTLNVINCTVKDREEDTQTSLVMIENGCPAASAKAVYRGMSHSNNGSSLHVTMAVFKFSSGDTLVVACFLKLCQQGDSSCDAKDCEGAGTQGVGRRRRDAPESNEMRISRTLKVRDPSGASQCEGGCHNDGLCVNVGGLNKCFCTDNFYGPTCALSQESFCASPRVFIIVLGVLGSLLLAMLVVSVLLVVKTRRHTRKTVQLGQPFSQPEPEPVRFTLPRVQCAHL